MKDDCKRELNQNGELKYVLGFEYSYSTLMRLRKDDLIDLLNIAQCNYEVAQNRIFNVTKYAEKLDEALKDAISILSGSGRCPHNCGYPCRETGKEDCQACWTKYFDEIYLIGDLKK